MSKQVWVAPLATLTLALAPALLLRDRYYLFSGPVLPGTVILGAALIVGATFARSSGIKQLLLGGFTVMLLVLNLLAVVALFGIIFTAGSSLRGGSLLLSAADCWLTNVATFALLFWYLSEVLRSRADPPILLFPESDGGTDAQHNIVDYIFVAATTALAFGPTDTPPATTSTRFVMLTEAMISFIIVAVVAARAFNAIQ